MAQTLLSSAQVPTPICGPCYEIIPGLIWAENEGSHADIYNNNACVHGPSPKLAECDNLYSSSDELCVVDNYIFIVEGGHSDMTISVLDFN